MNISRLIWLAFGGLCALQMSSDCAADLLRIEHEKFTAESPEAMVAEVLHQDQPVWKYTGTRFSDDGLRRGAEARIVYRPFLSSSDLCRTYASIIRTPHWLCEEGQCGTPALETYEIRTRAYVAQLEEPSAQCEALSFEADYFALERDLPDHEVVALLSMLSRSLDRWKLEQSDDERFEMLAPVTVRHVLSLELVPTGEEFIARFVMRHPRFETHRVIADLTIRGRELKAFDLYEQMP